MTYAVNDLDVIGTMTVRTGRRVMTRARVVLSDADHTIDVSQGDVFQLPEAPAAPRIITVLMTTPPIPTEGEVIKFVTRIGLAVGKQYTIRREDTTQVAEFWGSAAEDIAVTAEIEFTGGTWRIGMNCGGGATGGVVA